MEVIKSINMCETSLEIYIKAARGALNKLNNLRDQYNIESTSKELEEQLSTIAFYLEFNNKEELIEYLNQ
jgi:hypothetical protein